MLAISTGLAHRRGIQWSSFNSPATTWAADRLTQAGYADLDPRFGLITALVGGRYPMVFQERGISLVQYVGPPTVWRVSVVRRIGAASRRSAWRTIGSQTWFPEPDGFWMTNGSEFAPVGSQKGSTSGFSARWTTLPFRGQQAAVDWANRSIIWLFRWSAPDAYDRLLVYSPGAGQVFDGDGNGGLAGGFAHRRDFAGRPRCTFATLKT